MEKKVFRFKYNKFNPAVNEWSDSYYSYYKNNLNVLWANKIIFNIFKSYFNIKPYNNSFSNYINTRFPLKKIFVGTPEIKNNLNNVDISIYIFNKEKIVINNKIAKLRGIRKTFNKVYLEKKLNLLIKKRKSNLLINPNNYSNNVNIFNNYEWRNILLKYPISNYFKIYTNIILNHLENSLNIISILQKKIYRKFYTKNINNFIINKRDYKNNLINNENLTSNMEYILANTKLLMKKKYYILFLYKRYVTKLYFNKLKLNTINLLNLKKIFYNIYSKNVNINIINLKYLYLDNNIYIDAILKKLKKRNRRVLRVLRKALILPKIPRIDSMFLLKTNNKISDYVYNIINFNNIVNFNNIKKVIFESLKNIHVIGVRLEGKGRLTRRLTASRAIHKKAYKGSLKNIYSSFKGLSTLMTKGHNKSNLNYINLNSYNRNGSYGIKSWQNTM